MPEVPLPNPLQPRDVWKNIVGLAVTVALLALLFWYFDIELIREQIERAGVYGALFFVIAKASTIVIAPLSGSPLYPLAGALFGFWKGVLLLVLGDTLGGVVAFILARIFGRPLVTWMIGKDEGLFNRALGLMGTVRGYVVARFCFISMPEFASYGAGLTPLPFVTFFVIYTSIGALPSILFAWIGNALGDSGNGALISLIPLLTAFIAGMSMLVFFWYLHRESKKEPLRGLFEDK